MTSVGQPWDLARFPTAASPHRRVGRGGGRGVYRTGPGV
jgi:hypothetical protein